ncbi:PD-(D/E)XK nuclease family protein [Sulfuriroseicoccus oceanibius]|uniref:PD-(D/E)XK nuclease family protein n=1 Tax=Sulfuriroseicoccus oceanibius TaxID=2707525 RepID=A0A6B3LAG4_9BACT|nr:PD-(D/E)XK nuclease family protein [Sulfuriroseicoccus oceanibius]QQL43840.1 PD-(D/E)XK nuclease family protein [Sulfuriroseicoccus oceanibius]
MDETVVVVPTANSGRRLRQALAERAASGSSGALFPPRVVTPESFFRPTAPNVATRGELLVAWANVLRSVPDGAADTLFPETDTKRTFAWAMRAAKPLVTTCEAVAEADHDLAEVAELSDEPQRWQQLAALEQAVADYLAERGKLLPSTAKRETARAAVVPDGVTHMVIAGVADPVPLAVRAWSALSVPVHVLVHASESLADHFDVWGRPVADLWKSRVIDLPGGNASISLSASAEATAAAMVSDFAESGAASDQCAVGICDGDLTISVRDQLAAGGWRGFDPNGRPIAASGLVAWLGLWRELFGPRPSFDMASVLLKAPESLAVTGRGVSCSLGRQLDKLHEQAIPDTVGRALSVLHQMPDEMAERFDLAQPALSALRDQLAELNRKGTAAGMLKLVESLTAGSYDDGHDGGALEAVLGALDECAALEANGELSGGRELMDLVTELIRSARVPDASDDVVIDLQGWLELGYESAPHLALVGMHEGCVPENLNEDAFLPESLRRKLGLRDRDQRMARDGYLLSAMAASRSGEGRSLRCYLSKTAPNGDPRTPSRLMMRCADHELAERVRHCFAEAADEGKVIPEWQRGDWLLNVPLLENPYADGTRGFSPSALRGYLSCPFRFYLERVVKMSRAEAAKRELDAGQFGTLVHEVLEDFGREPAIRDSVDAEEIAAWLVARLDAIAQRNYSEAMTLPVMVQVASARERLRSFATIQAEQREAGWQIVDVEVRVKDWALDGVPINMTIDRIDRNSDGAYRVVDYKTSAKAKKPEGVHVAKSKGERVAMADLMEDEKGTPLEWQDLQLPMYVAYVAKTQGVSSVDVTAAYCNLGDSESSTGFEEWPISLEQMQSAMEWMQGAVARIRQGVFWPPSEAAAKLHYDEFGALAPDGFENAVPAAVVAALSGEEVAR